MVASLAHVSASYAWSEKCTVVEEETEIDEDFSTKAQKYVLSGETFYQFLEYGDRNAEVDLEIYWKEKDKNFETKLSVNYDKWNPNDIYSTIRYYLGISTY